MPVALDQQHATANYLLASLTHEERARILPSLQPAVFMSGDTVYECGKALDYIYFPTSCIVSLVYTMENGMSAEVGLIGNEGAVGISLFMGGDTMPHRATVLMAGNAIRMKSSLLREEFKRGGALQLRLLRYTQAFLTQITQTAVCNRFHSVEQRLGRWLLLCHDRARTDDLRMTQDFMSAMLGGRRQSVTLSAGRLQNAGLIQYSRGLIRILDRKGLEAVACECYRVVKNEFDRLLPINGTS